MWEKLIFDKKKKEISNVNLKFKKICSIIDTLKKEFNIKLKLIF